MTAGALWRDDNETAGTWSDDSHESHESAHRPRGERPLAFTKHAYKRGARRNVAPDAVEYVLAHGRMIQRTGVTFCFLGRRDMPPADRGACWASRLEGTIVLLAPNGTIITVYRNRRGLPAIRRKLKHRLPEFDAWYGTAADSVEREQATA
jgi:hypothetical protein